MNKNELSLYSELLSEIKARVRQAQQRAVFSANAEMILMYWDVGRMIASRQEREGWGAKVIPRLAVDLKNELPEEKGFSPANLKRMVRFWSETPEFSSIGARPVRQIAGDKSSVASTEISAQPVRQLSEIATDNLSTALLLQVSWSHNIALMQMVKDKSVRLWYARQTTEQGWSRDVLTAQIKSQAHERQGAAITNFGDKLPAMHAQLATGMLKDPFIFDFLTLEEPFHERELDTGLLHHIEKFLLELGRGFAFVGRQYRLDVSDRDVEFPISQKPSDLLSWSHYLRIDDKLERIFYEQHSFSETDLEGRLCDKVAGTFQVPSAESLATAQVSEGSGYGTRSVPATLEATQDYRGLTYV